MHLLVCELYRCCESVCQVRLSQISYVRATISARDFVIICIATSHVVGLCHHGMARPQVADGGAASDKEGSCE